MDLQQRLQNSGQSHLLRWYPELTAEQQAAMAAQLSSIDMDVAQRLFEQGESETNLPPLESLSFPPTEKLGAKEQAIGEELLRQGKVAVLMVAGGQGSRLGFPHAKGMYEIGPVSNVTLFQIHAEKIRALGRRYGKDPWLLIMTSEATDQEIREHFEDTGFYTLDRDRVIFFSQDSLPAVDFNGKLLLEAKDRVFTSPNGHGGVLQALHDGEVIPLLQGAGVTQVFYYQVDNPLVKVADPLFLGRHAIGNSEASSKVVRKQYPKEPIGNLVVQNGCCAMVEYTELPDDWAEMRDEHGNLKFWAGSIAIHCFSMDFLERMTQNYDSLPYHIAKKQVPYLDEHGREVKPKEKNAFKFERFIFDTLPLAKRWSVVETTHAEEFEPLKNATGTNSPATVRKAMIDLASLWLTNAGATVKPGTPVEISPMYAMDETELKNKIDTGMSITEPLYLQGEKE